MAHGATSGVITFNGELTETTCDVSVENKGPDAVVIVPTISAYSFDQQGQRRGGTDFTMSLSNCAGSANNVAAYFEAGPGVSPTGTVLNTGGTATNVEFALSNPGSGSYISAGNSQQLVTNNYYDISSGTGTMIYRVEYIAAGIPVAPGTVIGSVTYSLAYK